MILSKLNKILLGNRYVGVELFSLNGDDGAALVTIEKKNNELIILNKEKRGSFEKIIDKADKKLPIFLTINNNHVIHKEIEGIDVLDSKLFHKAFVNIKIEDFLYQIWRLDNRSIIAICRKSYIDELLLKTKQYGIQVSSINIGMCGISHIKDFLTYKVETNTQTINIESDLILLQNADNKSIKIYDVNGLDVQNTYLLAFSNVLGSILKNKTTSGNVKQLNDSLIDEYYQSSFFRKGFKFIVYSLLVILLFNFFVFNYYFKKSNETDISVQSDHEITQKMKTVSERLKYKEESLRNLNSSLSVKSSYIINEIVKNIPNSILLNEFTYHPTEKKIKTDEEILYLDNTLMISGKTINSNEFTNWLEKIESLKWIKSTTIIHFGKNENNESDFTIKLDIQ